MPAIGKLYFAHRALGRLMISRIYERNIVCASHKIIYIQKCEAEPTHTNNLKAIP